MRTNYLLKSLILTLLISGVYSLNAQKFQSELIGFYGIKFGCEQSVALSILKDKGVNEIERKQHGAKLDILFENVPMGEFTASSVLISFVNNKFFQASVMIKTKYGIRTEFERLKILRQ